MADNQEEKIKFLIKKQGIGIEEAIKRLGISKQTFYNNIRKEPLSKGFRLKLKEVLRVEVEESPNSQTKKGDPDEVRALKEALGDMSSKLYVEQEKNKVLRGEIEKLTKQVIELQNIKNTGT